MAKARHGFGLQKALHYNQFLPLAILWPSFVPNLSTHCTRCYNREAPIYKPKLTKRPTQAAVLDFINQLQCRYTNAQHQPQINVAHSNTSGHSDVATFLLAKKQLILQAH